MNAYLRVYIILSKKRIKLRSILLSIIVLTLNIPLKFIGLFYEFIKNKNNFRDWLEIKQSTLFFECENLNIEIINKKIYLNCFSLIKFARELKILKPNITKQETFNIMYDIKCLSKNLEELYKNSGLIKMTMGKIRNNEELITNVPHFTYSHYSNYKGLEIRNSIHHTSNTNISLINSQKIDAPIPCLIKPNASKPGTLITQNIIFVGSNKYI